MRIDAMYSPGHESHQLFQGGTLIESNRAELQNEVQWQLMEFGQNMAKL